jgi:hypothetical protein
MLVSVRMPARCGTAPSRPVTPARGANVRLLLAVSADENYNVLFLFSVRSARRNSS